MRLERLKGKGTEYLYRDPVSEIIYFRRYTKRTGEVYKSLKTREPNEAKRLRDELLRELEPKKKRISYLALEQFDEWVERKEIEGASQGTLTSINSSRAHLAPFLDVMLAEEITAEWWTSVYIKEVRAKTHKARKFFNDRKWLTAFLRDLHENGKVKKLHKFVNPDEKSEAGKVFTDDEVATLVHTAQNEDLRLAILMAATMGMRRLEIFGLRVDRIDVEARVIRLKAEDTKTRSARSFRISDPCWQLLKERVKNKVWIFENKSHWHRSLHKDGFNKAWTNLRRTTGITGRFHDLRHTFLTKAFKARGANPALICHYAGVSLEVAQSTYLHFDEKDTEAVAGLVVYENSGLHEFSPNTPDI